MSRREEVDGIIKRGGDYDTNCLARTLADEVDELRAAGTQYVSRNTQVERELVARDAIIDKLLAMLEVEGRSPEEEDEITDLASLIYHAYNDYDGDQAQMKKMRDDTQEALRAAACAVMNSIHARACEISGRKE